MNQEISNYIISLKELSSSLSDPVSAEEIQRLIKLIIQIAEKID